MKTIGSNVVVQAYVVVVFKHAILHNNIFYIRNIYCMFILFLTQYYDKLLYHTSSGKVKKLYNWEE